MSALPHVASVTLCPAYDSLGLRRTAYLAHFRIVGPLPREVHLFAPGGTPLRSLDGRPRLPLRLDVQRVCQPISYSAPRAKPLLDPVLLRSALPPRSVWGQAHK